MIFDSEPNRMTFLKKAYKNEKKKILHAESSKKPPVLQAVYLFFL